MSHEDYETEPVDPTLVTAADYETYVRPYIAALQAEVERLGKLVEPKEWLGWEQIDSIYDEARLLRKERDEMAALLTEAVRQDYGTPGWRERAIKAGCLIPGER
jgi:hypothetical protein